MLKLSKKTWVNQSINASNKWFEMEFLLSWHSNNLYNSRSLCFNSCDNNTVLLARPKQECHQKYVISSCLGHCNNFCFLHGLTTDMGAGRGHTNCENDHHQNPPDCVRWLGSCCSPARLSNVAANVGHAPRNHWRIFWCLPIVGAKRRYLNGLKHPTKIKVTLDAWTFSGDLWIFSSYELIIYGQIWPTIPSKLHQSVRLYGKDL